MKKKWMSKFPINLCIFFKFVNFNLAHKCMYSTNCDKNKEYVRKYEMW